ncbi:MAG: histidinol-phosphatase HisJ family protein [Ruminococcus sp.]|nr:histidinol-phosphatase HisJ family protein [Ruminococcus sp.]
MLLMDCHTHTDCSPDGTGTVEQLCERAVTLKLPVLAITDHVEMNRFFTQDYYGNEPRNAWEFYDYAYIMEQSLSDITVQKENYPDLQLLCGMEIGQPNADYALSEIVTRDKRLDFVIASLHELLDEQDFFELSYTEQSVPELLKAYFSQLLDICQNGEFDVLGHLTYPLRYIEGGEGISVDLTLYQEQIDACFEALIRRDKGIELNTSGYYQKYKPSPPESLLRRYREMGGKILTLGSDAHCADDLAKGISQGTDLAKAVGFDAVCYFVKRQPIFVKI